MDYHAILGVAADASPEELKKKYRKLAFETHPDRNNGNEEEFKKVTEAYEILTGKRKEQQRPPPSGGGFGFSPEDFQDIFNNMEGSARRRTARDNKPPLSEDEIMLNVQTSITQAKQGYEISVSYDVSKDCIICSGLGGEGKTFCVRCDGKGFNIYQQSLGGAMVFQTQAPCTHCQTKGFQFKKVCNKCSGNGWTVHEKRCIFEIKEKK